MRYPEITLRLPGWVREIVPDPEQVYERDEDRMRLAVELSRQNVRRGSGGPFGAVVFERDTGKVVSPGVNLVTSSGVSAFHAEMVAIMVAQKSLGGFDLGDYELVASTEPCAMCFGATTWSGVHRLVCGAREEDANRIGFDEGDKLPDWQRALEKRGIAVERDVLREEAAAVLREYVEMGGEIYNPLQNGA